MKHHASTRIGALLVAIVIAVGVCAGLSGCSLFGVNKAKQMQTDLANQRKVAMKLVEDYPNPELETIEFTDSGGVRGYGSWAANTVTTVAGTKYYGTLGTFFSIGDGLPPITSGAEPGPVTLVYSDGTSEVLNGHG
jgi:hypothetical protein